MLVPWRFEDYNNTLVNTIIHVRLEDASHEDVVSKLLSQRVINGSENIKFPIDFEIEFPKDYLNKTNVEFERLVVCAYIKNAYRGNILYASDTQYTIDVKHPDTFIKIMLKKV
jgi:uncharacterized lipoprotein YbaY